MIRCNQVCRYNSPDDGCLKPASAVCPMSNIARDTNALTNADHIRSMVDEELAKWIGNFVNRPIIENGMDGEFELDSNFVRDVYIWLKQPYKEDT